MSATLATISVYVAMSAQAGVVDFEIVEELSSASLSVQYDLAPLGLGVLSSVPQFAGSDRTSIYGQIWADLQPGTIEFPVGLIDAVNYRIGAPGSGGIPGSYAPFDPITTPPVFPPSGTTPGGNYGLTVGSPLSLAEVHHGLSGDLVLPGVKALAGTTFPLNSSTDGIVGTAGRIAFTSALAASSYSAVGESLAAFGTDGVLPGSWDPADFTAGPLGTLTIPIQSKVELTVVLNVYEPPIVVPVTYSTSGMILATPKIPEPSSIVLAVFGFVVFSTHAWLLRSRRASPRAVGRALRERLFLRFPQSFQ